MSNGMPTVFYVDDNARSRTLLGSVLAECGFQMITAGDPLEALCRCTKSCFDLALLDYQMPSAHRLTTGTGDQAPDAGYSHSAPFRPRRAAFR